MQDRGTGVNEGIDVDKHIASETHTHIHRYGLTDLEIQEHTQKRARLQIER